MTLNTEQTAALNAVKRRRNIFLTGAGGTGKSHTIRAITEWCQAAGIRIAVTAMTGCAAILLGNAKTLHSWAGIGLGRESAQELAANILKKTAARRRWLDTQVLVIDEISMMVPELLEKLDLVARRVRRQDTPFGGLRLILSGDFCQLPPVQKSTAFAFESPVWNTLVDETHELRIIERQSDPIFQTILTEARKGALSPESIAILKGRMHHDWSTATIRPTLLFSRNAEVDRINQKNMEALDGDVTVFETQTVVQRKTGEMLPSLQSPEVQRALERLDADSSYEKHLELKIGAQVMLLTNVNQECGLVNGSRGVVTGYSPSGLPMVRFLQSTESVVIERASWWLPDEEGLGSQVGRSQIPLKIAYAITIHKSQGCTLDCALIDIGSNTFEYGQAYVALSRVRSLEGLYIHRISPHMVTCHPKVRAFYDSLSTDVIQSESEEPVTPESSAGLKAALTGLSQEWLNIIEPFLQSPKGQLLQEKLASSQTHSPPTKDIFAALRHCPTAANIKVIILGQDPYPTAGNAHGLSFSVSGDTIPASLKNIFKELSSDVGSAPISGNLERWASQGVLLLNDILTVSVGAPLSHAGFGWEDLTAAILEYTLSVAPHICVLAWGRNAQKKFEKKGMVSLLTRHTILPAPHPSPLSAYTGFFGSKPFSKVNTALVAHGQEPIAWS